MRRLLVLTFAFYYLSYVFAVSISTTFAELVLRNLQIGNSYSTKKFANMPLCVTNTSDVIIDLRMEVLIPQPADLKKGYEPIPNTSWIKFEKDFFPQLKPGEQAVTDVIITIPYRRKYLGKKYQACLRSYTVGKRGGLSISVGLRSRLLFTIDSRAPKKVKKIGILQKILHFFGLKKR